MIVCDVPDCPNFATLVLAFTCGHCLCKTHEYVWTPECSACAQGVARRLTDEQARAAVRATFDLKSTEAQ